MDYERLITNRLGLVRNRTRGIKFHLTSQGFALNDYVHPPLLCLSGRYTVHVMIHVLAKMENKNDALRTSTRVTWETSRDHATMVYSAQPAKSLDIGSRRTFGLCRF